MRLGLQWLQEGRINGMIFSGANLCDLNIDAVNWTRDWIAQVGDQPLTTPEPPAIILLGIGLVGVPIYAWRKRR